MADRPSPIATGIGCKCPACGQGKLFDGYLSVVERCDACGVDLRARSSGDGPAVFVILVVGVLLAVVAWIIQAAFAPPIWVHGIVLPIAAIGGSLALLRPFKGVVVALEFHHGTPDQ